MSPLPSWWPLLDALSSHSVLVTEKRSQDSLFFPSKDVFFYLALLCIDSLHLGCRQQPNRRDNLSFQSLPLVPRLFQPSVSCPVCSKPNDFYFHYCQRCGYQRQTRSLQTLKSLKAPIDLCSIRERKITVVARRQATPYRKQRSVLEIEFSEFLESTSKRDICSAIPDDGIDFLIWNDNFGKTVVHIDTCPLFGEKSVVRSSVELFVLARGQAFS